jgi:hypothetical protein
VEYFHEGDSEQIRVASGPDQVEIIAIDLVEQQPVRLDMTIAMMLPLAA